MSRFIDIFAPPIPSPIIIEARSNAQTPKVLEYEKRSEPIDIKAKDAMVPIKASNLGSHQRAETVEIKPANEASAKIQAPRVEEMLKNSRISG
tara:strand:+ start:3843 stop:4121 length:279 start_codon:yes stop_codon:yes gene_type:complete